MQAFLMDGLLPRWTIGKHCFQCPLNTTTFPPNGSSAFCLSRHASPQSPAVLSRPSVGVVPHRVFPELRYRRLLHQVTEAPVNGLDRFPMLHRHLG